MIIRVTQEHIDAGIRWLPEAWTHNPVALALNEQVGGEWKVYKPGQFPQGKIIAEDGTRKVEFNGNVDYFLFYFWSRDPDRYYEHVKPFAFEFPCEAKVGG